uniref:uncharacterized protein isoform X2 n=1 Tax=Myxine glutinosa TaxID=7769 RepID=UPI00358E465F
MSKAKSTGKAPLFCVLHVDAVKAENVCPFTAVRWNKYRDCLEKWRDLDGNGGAIARSQYHNHAGVDFSKIPPSAGYHPTCYIRFIDKKGLLASQKRCSGAVAGAARISAVTGASVRNRHCCLAAAAPSPKKSLRSSSALPLSPKSHVLPRICIICKNESRYKIRCYGPKRDPLVRAETVTAGRLIEAAEIKEDESILVHTRCSDCVASEVCYHKLCFLQYTRFLSKERKKPTVRPSPSKSTYEEAYSAFCQDVIQTGIVNNQEVFCLTKLVDIFTEMVKEHHGVVLPSMRNDRMKFLLMQQFPQLIFHQPPRRNTSLLVCAGTLAVTTLAGELPSESSRGTESEIGAAEVSDADICVEVSNSSSTRPAHQANEAHTSGRMEIMDSAGIGRIETMDSANINVGFIGAGKMALALATGMIRSGVVNSAHIWASAPTDRNSVKFKDLFERARVIRMMPNAACSVQEGVIVFSLGEWCKQEHAMLFEKLLKPCGLVEEVPESCIDVHTGMSGSGIAYGYVFAEALTDGAVKMGMTRDLANKIAAQTLLGAGKMLLESGQHVGLLRDNVVSPGGTTSHGLHQLEKGCFRATVISAVEAATMRAQFLGNQ